MGLGKNLRMSTVALSALAQSACMTGPLQRGAPVDLSRQDIASRVVDAALVNLGSSSSDARPARRGSRAIDRSAGKWEGTQCVVNLVPDHGADQDFVKTQRRLAVEGAVDDVLHNAVGGDLTVCETEEGLESDICEAGDLPVIPLDLGGNNFGEAKERDPHGREVRATCARVAVKVLRAIFRRDTTEAAVPAAASPESARTVPEGTVGREAFEWDLLGSSQ